MNGVSLIEILQAEFPNYWRVSQEYISFPKERFIEIVEEYERENELS